MCFWSDWLLYPSCAVAMKSDQDGFMDKINNRREFFPGFIEENLLILKKLNTGVWWLHFVGSFGK